jgi:hypothetical protein
MELNLGGKSVVVTGGIARAITLAFARERSGGEQEDLRGFPT